MAVRLLSFPLTAVVVVAGVWVAGGVITDDFRASIALTTVWFGLAGAAALLIARSRRDLRWPVLAAYVITAAVVGGYLGLNTLRDRVVDESLAAGTTLAAGDFASLEHTTTGTAKLIRTADGRHVLQLSGFETAAGPDLRVRLVPGDVTDGGAEGAVDLGALKGNVGDQQYTLPGPAPDGPHTIVIWCRAFSAAFGRATIA